MAKMHFKYATMNSGKSIDIIRTAHNYEENGFNVLLLKSSLDTKVNNCISSRIGLNRKVDYNVLPTESILNLLKGKLKSISCILVDEAQFLTTSQVEDLFVISKSCDIPVICYGLRNNFKMESFTGSKRLLDMSDVLEELITLCSCGEIARYAGRKENGIFIEDGEEIVIDGTENVEYVPLCGECYLSKVKRLNLNNIKKKLVNREE